MLFGPDQAIWELVIKRGLAILVLASFGIHAYVQYRRRGKETPTPRRWVYFSFSLTLAFAVVVNMAMLILAVRCGIKGSQFKTGVFSFMIFMLYLIYASNITQRAQHLDIQI